MYTTINTLQEVKKMENIIDDIKRFVTLVISALVVCVVYVLLSALQ